uniref:Secreted protein n=1 Tax=Trichogramma kaykai TaxID=54128 RepID=A0ABD2WEB1_9HYME
MSIFLSLIWISRYCAGGSSGDTLSWLVVSSCSAKMLDAFLVRRLGAAARKVSRAIGDARRTTIALSRRASGRTHALAELDEVFDGSARPAVHGRTEMTWGLRRSSCSALSMLSAVVMSGVETDAGIPVTRTSQESTVGVEQVGGTSASRTVEVNTVILFCSSDSISLLSFCLCRSSFNSPDTRLSN